MIETRLIGARKFVPTGWRSSESGSTARENRFSRENRDEL